MPLSEPIIGKDGNVLKEIFVPAGTELILGIRSINIDKGIWGEDALEFKPERWLGANGRELEQYLVSFSKGPRACIGQK